MAIVSIEAAQNYYVARKICVTSWEALLALDLIATKSFIIQCFTSICVRKYTYILVWEYCILCDLVG